LPKVIKSEMIVPNIHLLTVESPAVSREVKPGQFVILRADEEGERIPLSIADWDAEEGTVTALLMNVGSSTEIEKFGTVVCLGGCYGIGSIFPIVRALKEKGNQVITVIEARSSYLFYWEEKLKGVSDKIFNITRDGTKGLRGHVSRLPEIIKLSKEPVDRVIINGCTFLLKRGSDVTRPLGIKTIVSLNPIMLDGTGMCGVCRVTVGSVTKFACVHGPDFDGHQVDWAELLQRRKTYMTEEVIPLRTSRCEEHAKT
jgi:ferredoxin--NADP+ reductase